MRQMIRSWIGFYPTRRKNRGWLKYFTALGSRQLERFEEIELKQKDDDLYKAVAHRDGQITALNQAIAERDGQIIGLNQAVAERDGQIIGLNQAVADRDGQIIRLNQAVAERDGQIIRSQTSSRRA